MAPVAAPVVVRTCYVSGVFACRTGAVEIGVCFGSGGWKVRCCRGIHEKGTRSTFRCVLKLLKLAALLGRCETGHIRGTENCVALHASRGVALKICSVAARADGGTRPPGRGASRLPGWLLLQGTSLRRGGPGWQVTHSSRGVGDAKALLSGRTLQSGADRDLLSVHLFFQEP